MACPMGAARRRDKVGGGTGLESRSLLTSPSREPAWPNPETPLQFVHKAHTLLALLGPRSICPIVYSHFSCLARRLEHQAWGTDQEPWVDITAFRDYSQLTLNS